MFSPICNLLKPIDWSLYRRSWVRMTLCLGCLILIASNIGCRKDCAQWNVAAAINEENKGNSEGAIELLQKALRMDPDSDDIKLDLALLLAKNDQGDLSQTLCDEVLESDPNSEDAWRVLSECLHLMGRFDDSLAAYQKHVADKIDKGPNELNQLAYFRALAGVQLDKALRQINEAIYKYEHQLEAETRHSWGSFSYIPMEIKAVVSAGLLSRYTEEGHQHVMGLLNDKIQVEQELWLAANARFQRLYDQKENQGNSGNDQDAEEQQEHIEDASDQVERIAGVLSVLLATRSLMFDDKGQTELADLDRLWIKQVGEQPQKVYGTLPSDRECLSALSEIQAIIDTRGYILTQLPWQPTWTHPSGVVMKIEDRTSLITYGSYERALKDLDLAVVAAEVRLLVLDSDAVNWIEYPPERIPADKANGAKLIAILRNHRRQAHLKANQVEAAQRDQERIEELDLKAGENLF